ncbi:MAG: site-specific integrase [Egibacteraceae bacterium]
MTSPIAFPALLPDCFGRGLVNERGASAHTIASYRDTFALLGRYASQRTGRTPSQLRLDDLDSPLIPDFLDHLETDRGNSPRTRNLRLTAIRSFMRHACLRDPTCLPVAGACSPSVPNASTGPHSTSCPAKRSKRCSTHPTPASRAGTAMR